MHLLKNTLSKSVAMALLTSPIAAFASLVIVTDSGRDEVIPQTIINEEMYKQVVNIGNKKFVNHPVDSFATDLPLGVVLPTILPLGWVSDISDDLSLFPVTWSKTGNWDDVLVEISKQHDLVVMFDWNRNIVKIKENDAELLKIKDVSIVSFDVTENDITDKTIEPVFETNTVVAEKDKEITDSLVVCTENEGAACSSLKVDIEKLVLDTEWLDNPSLSKENKIDSNLISESEENDKNSEGLVKKEIDDPDAIKQAEIGRAHV